MVKELIIQYFTEAEEVYIEGEAVSSLEAEPSSHPEAFPWGEVACACLVEPSCPEGDL